LLTLQTDAQTNNAPFQTRWEAIEDIVKDHEHKSVDPKKFELNPIVHHNDKADLERRLWIFPYMGLASETGAAALTSFGINAIVAPSNTPEAQAFARKHVTTDACLPTKGVVGDMLAQLYNLKEEGIDPNEEVALVLPSAKGPCRFGQYRSIMRKFLDKEGFTGVPIVSPMSNNDYADIPIEPSKIQKLTKIYYSGIYSFDVLYDSLLRTRPYEKQKGSADKAFKICFTRLLAAMETGDISSIVSTMQHNAGTFKEVEIDSSERKPMVLYAGEIYMRWHDGFTQNSVEKLEENNLEVIRQPISEWINYINRSHISRYWKQAKRNPFSLEEWKKLWEVGKKRLWINHIERKIRRPFAELLAGREFHNPMDFIYAVEESGMYHRDIEGESPLSIGAAYELMHGFENIAGIFHVGPWMCMQETTATAIINAMKDNYTGELLLPILHASFGDSPNLNLAAEIAVFREQCYARRDQIRERRQQRKPSYTDGMLFPLNHVDF
jgi:predicted nucleotide-binding protein (sugar kinase/HSP70/actin superfamily)